MAKNEKWIQKTPIKKGALTNTVKRQYGSKGFTDKGTIKVSVLRQLSKKRTKTGKQTKTSRRAQLALSFRGFGKKI